MCQDHRSSCWSASESISVHQRDHRSLSHTQNLICKLTTRRQLVCYRITFKYVNGWLSTHHQFITGWREAATEYCERTYSVIQQCSSPLPDRERGEHSPHNLLEGLSNLLCYRRGRWLGVSPSTEVSGCSRSIITHSHIQSCLAYLVFNNPAISGFTHFMSEQSRYYV